MDLLMCWNLQESISKVNELRYNYIAIVHLHVDGWRCVRRNMCPMRKQSHENGANVGF